MKNKITSFAPMFLAIAEFATTVISRILMFLKAPARFKLSSVDLEST